MGKNSPTMDVGRVLPQQAQLANSLIIPHVTAQTVSRATSVDLSLDNMSPVIISTTFHASQLAARGVRHLVAYLDFNLCRPSPTSLHAPYRS
jgi:hypothetical protein